jgi:endonuclease/exonuclease/phosphatase family metal-dependent hydrolase
MELKIITFNIWDLHVGFGLVKDRESRFKGIIKKILELDADIICLQEAWDPEHRLELRKHLTPKYHTTIESGKIKTRQVLYKKFDATGGLVILSKFPIINWEFTPFARYAHTSLIEFAARKGFISATLDTPTGELQILNTHLNAEGIAKKRIRKKQFKLIMDSVTKCRDSAPLIIGGDFNIDRMMSDPFYVKILSGNDLIEPASFTKIGHISTHRPDNIYAGSFFHPALKPLQFDYFFIKNVTNPENINIKPLYFEPPLSDHDPLMLTISIPDKV